MADCRYCTNYHLNSHERVDNSCLGPNDCRSSCFSCNERLKPNFTNKKVKKQKNNNARTKDAKTTDLSNNESTRYDAILGYNTKQWWAYDNKTDEYCDPPIKVLDEIKQHSDNIDEQRDYFNDILSKEPEWLNDKGHRYNEIEY